MEQNGRRVRDSSMADVLERMQYHLEAATESPKLGLCTMEEQCCQPVGVC